jgi:hypothetical protein
MKALIYIFELCRVENIYCRNVVYLKEIIKTLLDKW